MNLLMKGAAETILLAYSKSGYYFLIPKKDSGLRPILDHRQLNQICLGDWLFSVGLKDVYIHIQITLHYRPFLRFVFKEVAYKYTV